MTAAAGAAQDSLRAVLDTVFAAPAYRWVEQPAPFRLLRQWWRMLGDWLAEFSSANPGLFRLLALVLVAVLVGIFVHAGWVMLQAVRSSGERDAGPAVGARWRDAAWYRAEADRRAEAGDYAGALAPAFTAVALTLDAGGIARFHPSKTPREIERDARVGPGDRERLRGLVRALYAHHFGGVPCGPEDYRRWRAAADGEWHAAAH